MASEQALLDEPCAITSFYADATAPRLPILAVAAGPSVYLFRKLRPYYKFTLPLDPVDSQEREIW